MAETKVVLCLPLGGGRAGRPGKHMLGHSRALSAQRLSVTCEWSWGGGRGRENSLGSNEGKTEVSRVSSPRWSPETQNLSPGAYVGLADP